MDTLMRYVETFATLRRERSRDIWTDKTGGGAPHKPLLLLSIIDLFAKGELDTPFIELGPAIEKQFASYWVLVTEKVYAGDIVHPFFALKNERSGFWSLIPRPGNEQMLITKPDWVRLDLDHLRQCVLGARIDEDLCKLLSVEEHRLILRQTLMERHFAPSTMLQLAGFTSPEDRQYVHPARRQSTLNRLLRDSAEAISIKRLYDYSCQMCQTRLAVGGQPYAEAAHIKPLGRPHDGPDCRANLLCLCPNHHVLFDLGGLSISDGLKVIPDGGALTVHSTHRIERAFLRYHREEICGDSEN
jgi:predicted restriction endonuclease